jgi:hypothetical protein
VISPDVASGDQRRLRTRGLVPSLITNIRRPRMELPADRL